MQIADQKVYALKRFILRLRDEVSPNDIQEEFQQLFEDANVVDVLLAELTLLMTDDEITIEDMKRLEPLRARLTENGQHEKGNKVTEAHHPIQIYKEENAALLGVLNRMKELLMWFEQNPSEAQETAEQKEMQLCIQQLGEFHNHYHRKEKLFFPIMERYGYMGPLRTMWMIDDQIRVLYQGLKGEVNRLPEVDPTRIQKRFHSFAGKFKKMIFKEEKMLLPILQYLFTEENWLAVANESEAFGYALIEAPKEKRMPTDAKKKVAHSTSATENFKFGGGYLTTEEANLILNNLPLEITFIDQSGLFKYFNEMTAASEMMLVRTPSSIGRHVSNCHPPKSLKKVMTIIRDLKSGIRTSESMWFKKKDEYIHITYKAIFNEHGEFMGVLEYVQDIQPFLELPNEIKKGLSKLDH